MKRLIAIALLAGLLAVPVTGCASEPEASDPEGDGLHSIVPGVVGLIEADAVEAIENAGYVVGSITSESADGAVSGEVIEQDPIASTSAPRGAEVDLVVAE